MALLLRFAPIIRANECSDGQTGGIETIRSDTKEDRCEFSGVGTIDRKGIPVPPCVPHFIKMMEYVPKVELTDGEVVKMNFAVCSDNGNVEMFDTVLEEKKNQAVHASM